MQKLKELIKLSNLCNFQLFASNIEGNISHQKLRNCWVAKKLMTHTFSVKFRVFRREFPAMLAISPVYRIQLWITMFLKIAASLERTAFVHNLMQQIKKTLWVLWNCLDTCRYFLILFYFFIEKVRQKYFFSSNTFQFIKKLEHELNEL